MRREMKTKGFADEKSRTGQAEKMNTFITSPIFFFNFPACIYVSYYLYVPRFPPRVD